MLLEFNELVETKLTAGRWSEGDIKMLVKLVGDGTLSPEQIGAVLMLIFVKGMDFQETVNLTYEMTSSGEVLTWPEEIRHLVVDKHSTGGVGDKVSLALVPSLLCLGLKVPMISGRSLGHTGGTVDKLESIPGFRVGLSSAEMRQAVLSGVGGFIAGQTESVAPVDRVLYAARSRTATVSSVPLITASILSKKAAEGLAALVMDVKFGRAAAMTEFSEAMKLAECIEATGRGYGMKVTVFLTGMNQPLGNCVGNAVEIAESLRVLNGLGPEPLNELVAQQGGCLMHHAGLCETRALGAELVRQSWGDNGGALKAFRDLLVSQGVKEELADSLCQRGDFSVTEYLQMLGRQAAEETLLMCQRDGFVSDIDALSVAKICHQLARPGGQQSEMNFSAGLELLVAKGDAVKQGQPWVRVFHGEQPLTDGQLRQLESCLILTVDRPEIQPLIRQIFPID